MLTTFDAAATAVQCAAAIVGDAIWLGLHVRCGVHTGEVQQLGTGVRGIAVHETARVMAQAGTDEVLVSETTRVLAASPDLTFEDRGPHQLKGFEGERRLYALVTENPTARSTP
jgi:class 3 adenylate cyclase